jgi:DNA-binding SARP family transcriptional activator
MLVIWKTVLSPVNNSSESEVTTLDLADRLKLHSRDAMGVGPMAECKAAASFRILGPVEAWVGESRLDLGGPRQLMLLAYLLVNANRAVQTDAVIDAVWPQCGSTAGNRLPMAITRLRKALGQVDMTMSSRLRTVGGGYLLSVAPGELDADLFNAGIQAGLSALDRDDAAAAAASLESALTMWRGTPLAEVYYEDFAQAESRRLEELYLLALETRADAKLKLGRHVHLVAELEHILIDHPGRERIASQLMLALYRAGRQSDALDVYQRIRSHMAAVWALEPGPALRTMQLQILRQSPELERTDPFHGSARATSHADYDTRSSCGGRAIEMPIKWTKSAPNLGSDNRCVRMAIESPRMAAFRRQLPERG